MRAKLFPLLDQAFVSLTNLVTALFIIKVSGMEVFSVYQFALIFIFLVTIINNNSVVACFAEEKISSELASQLVSIAFAVSLALSGVFVLLMSIFPAGDYTAIGARYEIMVLFFILYLAQDLLKRIEILRNNFRVALASDILSYGGQFSAVAFCYFYKMEIDASTVFLIIAITCAAGIFPFLVKSEFRFFTYRIGVESSRAYVGKLRYLVMSALAKFFSSQIIFLVMGAIYSPVLFGAVKAAQLVYKPFNLFIVAYESYFPKLLFDIEDKGAVASLCKKTSLLLCTSIVLYFIAQLYLIEFFSSVVEVDQEVFGKLTVIWCVFFILLSLSLVLRSMLRRFQREREILMSAVASFVTSVIFCVPAILGMIDIYQFLSAMAVSQAVNIFLLFRYYYLGVKVV